MPEVSGHELMTKGKLDKNKQIKIYNSIDNIKFYDSRIGISNCSAECLTRKAGQLPG